MHIAAHIHDVLIRKFAYFINIASPDNGWVLFASKIANKNQVAKKAQRLVFWNVFFSVLLRWHSFPIWKVDGWTDLSIHNNSLSLFSTLFVCVCVLFSLFFWFAMCLATINEVCVLDHFNRIDQRAAKWFILDLNQCCCSHRVVLFQRN